MERIPVTTVRVGLQHNELTREVTMDSCDFFSTLTMATNYAHDKFEEIKTKGMKDFKIADPGLETKVILG